MASQYPQAPTPETWLLLASVCVEHQGLGSSSVVAQPEWETPLKLKGKMQVDPDAGPDVALHTVDLKLNMRKAGKKYDKVI